MKNLPRHIQELIADRLDPKSSARLRAVSRDMKEVVDATRPPTGSYQRKTGRYQKRFSIRGMKKCEQKHASHFGGMRDIRHHARFLEFGLIVYDELKKSYKRNTLLRDFKSITAERTEDEYWKEAIEIFPHLASDHTFRDEMTAGWHEETKNKRDFRRRVVRLIKLWARANESYTETLRLMRRRTVIYANADEQKNKDRLMDAIIVQTAVLHPADDPTQTIVGKDGAPLSIEQKIARVVKLCRTSVITSTTRDDP